MSDQNAVDTHFTSVSKFVNHLEALEHETLPKDWVIAHLKGIRPAKNNAAQVQSRARGQLAGVSLDDMSLEQLKRERINAGSVLYKAKQRGANEETITKNQQRYDAVIARINELGGQAPVEGVEAAAVAAETSEGGTEQTEAPVVDDSVPESETSAEL